MNENPWKDMTLEEARAYDARKETGPLRHQIAVKRRIIWNMIAEHLPDDRSASILDLGGGTGVWAIRLAEEGYRVLLADISPGFLARAGEKAEALGVADRITIEEADIDDLSRFPEGRFPLVLALGDPLSYCRDPLAALQGIRRITAPGGVLIGDVENRYGGVDSRRAGSWQDVRRILTKGIAVWPGTDAHVRMFAPSQIQDLIRAAGWELVAMYPSDLLSSLLDREFLDGLLSAGEMSDEDLRQWVELEEELREDPHLLGCGPEIQFVARNA